MVIAILTGLMGSGVINTGHGGPWIWAAFALAVLGCLTPEEAGD